MEMSFGLVTIIPATYVGLDLNPLFYERNMSNLAVMLTYHMSVITWLEPKGEDNTPLLS